MRKPKKPHTLKRVTPTPQQQRAEALLNYLLLRYGLEAIDKLRREYYGQIKQS